MWVLRFRDRTRAAAVRLARRRTSHRVPLRGRPQGLPAIGRGERRHRRRACRGRVTNKKRTKGGWHFRGKVPATFSGIVACAVLLATHPLAAQRPITDRVLVMPFENTRHEPRLQWRGEASAVLLEDHLTARRVAAIPRDERVRAFEDLHLPLTAS